MAKYKCNSHNRCTSYACHNCKRGRGDWCILCKRVDSDDIRIRKTPHNRDELTAARTVAADTRSAVTPFAPDAEDALRALLSVLAELPPNVVLILHGLLNGKSLVEIGALTGDTKQTVCARLKAAMQRFPWIGVFYKTVKRGGWRFAGYVAGVADKNLTARQ